MKFAYSLILAATAALLAVAPAHATLTRTAESIQHRTLEGKIPGMHRLKTQLLPEELRTTPVKKAAEGMARAAQKATNLSLSQISDWARMDGMCKFHDDYVTAEFNLPTVEFDAPILNSKAYPNVYALQPYGPYHPNYADLKESGMINPNVGVMLVDARDFGYVSIPMFQSGTTITWEDDNTTEDILMVSLNWVMEFIGHDAALVKNAGLGGVNDAGHIYFPCTESVVFTTSSLMNAAEKAGDILQGFYAMDRDGEYGFYLPGVDPSQSEAANSIELSTPKYCFDDNKVTLHMKAGSNIKIFKIGFYQAYTDDMFDDIVANGQGGTYEAEGDLVLDLNGSAGRNPKLYVGVVAGDAQGNIKDYDVIEVYIVPGDDDMWEDAGYCELTDGIFAPIYQLPTTPYTLKYQRYKDEPGYIRVVNPYTCDAWPHLSLVEPFEGHNHNHYIYINATDPDGVYLETSPLGVTPTKEEGEMKVSSKAVFKMEMEGKTLEEVKKEGLTGKLNALTKTITFPANSLMVANVNYKGGQYFNTNKKGEFALKLDVPSAVNSVEAEEAEGAAEYFNLQGIRVANPAGQPGIYVKCTADGKSAKVMIR